MHEKRRRLSLHCLWMDHGYAFVLRNDEVSANGRSKFLGKEKVIYVSLDSVISSASCDLLSYFLLEANENVINVVPQAEIERNDRFCVCFNPSSKRRKVVTRAQSNWNTLQKQLIYRLSGFMLNKKKRREYILNSFQVLNPTMGDGLPQPPPPRPTNLKYENNQPKYRITRFP